MTGRDRRKGKRHRRDTSRGYVPGAAGMPEVTITTIGPGEDVAAAMADHMARVHETCPDCAADPPLGAVGGVWEGPGSPAELGVTCDVPGGCDQPAVIYAERYRDDATVFACSAHEAELMSVAEEWFRATDDGGPVRHPAGHVTE